MMSKLNVRQMAHVSCTTCSLSHLCLPLALKIKGIDELDKIIHRRCPLQKGDHLFLEGDPFHSVYVVRSGTLKTYITTNEGEEQITSFYLPSELVGLSALYTATYPVSTQAIETTTVCEIPFDRLEKLSDDYPSLRHQMMRILCRKIRADQQMKLLLSKKSADERIATFLINLANRFHRRGLSPQSFRLPMSRNEIGNYLGLVVETVSRVFTRFQKKGLIHANGKEVEIINSMELFALSERRRVDQKDTVNIL